MEGKKKEVLGAWSEVVILYQNSYEKISFKKGTIITFQIHLNLIHVWKGIDF